MVKTRKNRIQKRKTRKIRRQKRKTIKGGKKKEKKGLTENLTSKESTRIQMELGNESKILSFLKSKIPSFLINKNDVQKKKDMQDFIERFNQYYDEQYDDERNFKENKSNDNPHYSDNPHYPTDFEIKQLEKELENTQKELQKTKRLVEPPRSSKV